MKGKKERTKREEKREGRKEEGHRKRKKRGRKTLNFYSEE